MCRWETCFYLYDTRFNDDLFLGKTKVEDVERGVEKFRCIFSPEVIKWFFIVYSLAIHTLCVDKSADVFELLLECGVIFHFLFYFFARVDDGGVIAPTELLTYRGV